MPEVNELLRAARLRLESPSAPGLSMTRQELAEAVNTQVHRTTGKITAADANHIGKWERGIICWPAAYYRAALRALLDVGSDAEIGFTRPNRDNAVDRQTFIKTALGVGAGMMITPHVPNTDDRDELVAALSGATTYYRRMEQTVSSARLAPAVDAHFSLASDVVRTRLNNTTGYGALAEIAGLAAWLAADQGDHVTARRRYGEAVLYAEKTYHPLLAAYMTASFGHFAIETGHARQGVTLLDRAGVQLDNTAPDTVRAWLASLHAVGHATLGDPMATRGALRAAEKLTSRARGEPQWPWIFAFDRAKATRYQAGALARLGDLSGATIAYNAAQPTITGVKPRALDQLDHAHALVAAGQYGEGCRLALDALQVGREYGSQRIIARVRDLHAHLPARTVEARAMDDALMALYDTEVL